MDNDTTVDVWLALTRRVADEARSEGVVQVAAGDDPSDVAHEVADRWVPLYTDEIAAVAAAHPVLLSRRSDYGPAWVTDEADAAPVNWIAANIYEELVDIAADALAEATPDHDPDGHCCDDCAVFIANGDLPDDDTRSGEVVAGVYDLERGGDQPVSVVLACGDDCDTFSWSSCDLCGSPLGGQRHPYTVVTVGQVA